MELQLKPNSNAVTTAPMSTRKAKGWEYSQELEWILNESGEPVLREE